MNRKNDNLHGALALDKPAGWSSFDVVREVKRHLRGCKVGHTGTLDPMATGLLLVLVGQATKLARFLGQGKKKYVARLQLGVETDTWDAEGRPVSRSPVPPLVEDQCRRVLAGFVGEIEQTPPRFSALRVNGRRMYELARRGVEVNPRPRRVVIHSMKLLKLGPDWLEIEVVCGPGTYIRSLAVDISRKLGTSGHLAGLTRTETGGFGLERAFDPRHISREEIEKKLIALPELCERFGPVELPDSQMKRLASGNPLPPHLLRKLLENHPPGGQTLCFHDKGWTVVVIGEQHTPPGRPPTMKVLRVLKTRGLDR